MVSGPKQLEIAERRRKVGSLYLMRFTQEEIARQVGVTQKCISTDIKAIKEQYKAEREELIERDLAELEQMERDCAMQFAQTKDREWISERREIKKRRSQMIGLDAPVKTDNRNENRGEIVLRYENDWRGRGTEPDETGDRAAVSPSGAAEGDPREETPQPD